MTTPIPEPHPNSIVWWSTPMPNGKAYSFAAIHIGGVGWYVTGQWTAPVTWAEVLCLARGSPVYAATHWTSLDAGPAT
jgi:hypothetical protein